MRRATASSLTAIGQRNSAEPLIDPIRPNQLRQLQTLWHLWTKSLGLPYEPDQRLRHYYVSVFSDGRARQTLELTAADAQRVIRWLQKLLRLAAARNCYAAGTAGRRGYPEQRWVPPSYPAWRALWACATELGMQRGDLDRFIHKHYSRRGLGGIADLHTMADLNRVLWGLKEILRRRAKEQPSTMKDRQAA